MTVFEDMAKDIEDNIQFIKMGGLGVYIFKILKVYDPIKEKKKVPKKNEYITYYERPMKVKTVYFDNVELYSPIIKTKITENKYQSMARTVCLLKKNGIIKTYDEIGDWYVMYFKRNEKTVQYVFLDQKKFEEYLPYVKEGKVLEIDKKILWCGSRHLKEGEIERYYNENDKESR